MHVYIYKYVSSNRLDIYKQLISVIFLPIKNTKTTTNVIPVFDTNNLHDAINTELTDYRKNNHEVDDTNVFYRFENVDEEFKYVI